MSERERLKQLIDRLPEHELEYIEKLIFSIEKTGIEEVEPDEWDLRMIAEAEANNDGHGIPIEALAVELGITL